MMPDRGQYQDYSRQSVGAEVHHALGKGFTLRGGYTYGTSQRGDGPTHEHHIIDGGVGYGRSLSLSRRTTLSLSTGSFGQKTSNNYRFHLTGSATLIHELGHSWSLAGSVGRSVLVYEAYDDPVVRDGLSVRLHGLLTRRVSFSATAQTSLGNTSRQGRDTDAFSAVRAAVSAGIAINEYARGSIVYSYYMHRYDQKPVMPNDLPYALDRHGVRALLNVWAPLFYRMGRGNATR
jgi:hypothetical protein